MSPIALDTPLALLGGLTPARFMRSHWQRKPLLIRQAITSFTPPVDAQRLFALAASEAVQSRLITQTARGWALRHGPFSRRQLPPQSRPGWTLLVQGVDLHDAQAHALQQQFAFIPQARLDDLMISYASDGGGVGPHFDSYDVFLLQAQGRRRWRIGKQKDLRLQQGVPLRLLEHFEAEQEWLLEPGDMLYLPPRYAHDGIAEGPGCMTYSIGFRSPGRRELAATLLERLAEPDWDEDTPASSNAHAAVLYRDAGQPATAQPGAIPPAMQQFARDAMLRRLQQPHAIEQLLGEYLSEPHPSVVFEGDDAPLPPAQGQAGITLGRKTRMLYDERFLYVNGESWRIGGRDAALLRQLADTRWLAQAQYQRLSPGAQGVLQEWAEQGWLFFMP